MALFWLNISQSLRWSTTELTLTRNAVQQWFCQFSKPRVVMGPNHSILLMLTGVKQRSKKADLVLIAKLRFSHRLKCSQLLFQSELARAQHMQFLNPAQGGAALHRLWFHHWSKMPPEDSIKPLWCVWALGRCLLIRNMTGSSCLDSHSPVKLSNWFTPPIP